MTRLSVHSLKLPLSFCQAEFSPNLGKVFFWALSTMSFVVSEVTRSVRPPMRTPDENTLIAQIHRDKQIGGRAEQDQIYS